MEPSSKKYWTIWEVDQASLETLRDNFSKVSAWSGEFKTAVITFLHNKGRLDTKITNFSSFISNYKKLPKYNPVKHQDYLRRYVDVSEEDYDEIKYYLSSLTNDELLEMSENSKEDGWDIGTTLANRVYTDLLEYDAVVTSFLRGKKDLTLREFYNGLESLEMQHRTLKFGDIFQLLDEH